MRPRQLPQTPLSGRGDRQSYQSGAPDDTNRRKQGLQLFFELRDRKYTSIIEDLFRFYDFEDIAKGVYEKYKMLPVHWKSDLEQMKQMGNASLAWFNPARVKYLDEMTDSYPSVEKSLKFPDREDSTKGDRVVDEFIINERDYFDKLQAFMQAYVAEVEAIANDRVGVFAKDALGLDKGQVEFIFGSSLLKVLHAAESLLVVLETLVLVPASPKVPGGRPGLLAEIISYAGRSLVQAYGPYNANYQLGKKILEKKTMDLAKKPKMDVPPGTMKHLNFMELWTEISKSKTLLKQGTMDLILISPIKRLTNYGLFFDRLRKELPPQDPCQPKIVETLTKIKQFATEVDERVGENSFVEAKFPGLMD